MKSPYNKPMRERDWWKWKTSHGDHGSFYWEVEVPCWEGANFRETAVAYLMKHYQLPFSIALAEVVTSSYAHFFLKPMSGRFDDFDVEAFVQTLSKSEADFITTHILQRKIAEQQLMSRQSKSLRKITSFFLLVPYTPPMEMYQAIKKRFR